MASFITGRSLSIQWGALMFRAAGWPFLAIRSHGHNKWSKIHRDKAVVDKERCKVIAAFSREIICAIKANGPDTAINRKLANALERAKAAEVPKRIIDNALQRVTNDCLFVFQFAML